MNKLRNLSILLTVTVVLAGCTSSFMRLGTWPSDIPPRAYFDGVYAADIANRYYQERDDYLSWVLTFYQGNTMSDGWLDMREEVLSEVPAQRQDVVAAQLATLGQIISGEWAKSNEVRLIDTRCASIWREALLEAIYQNDVENFLRVLEQDVEAILAGDLSKDEIAYERYYEVEEIDFI